MKTPNKVRVVTARRDQLEMRAFDLYTGNLLWTGPVADDQGQSGPTFWRGEVFQMTLTDAAARKLADDLSALLD